MDCLKSLLNSLLALAPPFSTNEPERCSNVRADYLLRKRPTMTYEAWCDLVPGTCLTSSLPTWLSPFSTLLTIVSSVISGTNRAHFCLRTPTPAVPSTSDATFQTAVWLAPSPHFLHVAFPRGIYNFSWYPFQLHNTHS